MLQIVWFPEESFYISQPTVSVSNSPSDTVAANASVEEGNTGVKNECEPDLMTIGERFRTQPTVFVSSNTPASAPVNTGVNGGRDRDDDDEENSSDADSIESELEEYDQMNRVYGKQSWNGLLRGEVDKIPNDIDGKCAFSIKAPSRTVLLEQCTDGRPWRKDTRTKWAGYESVRYKNCEGLLRCPNVDCAYMKEFGDENRLRFDKSAVRHFLHSTLFHPSLRFYLKITIVLEIIFASCVDNSEKVAGWVGAEENCHFTWGGVGQISLVKFPWKTKS